MNFFSKIMEAMRLTDEEDDDYYLDDDEYVEEEREPKRKFFQRKEAEYDEEDEDVYEEEPESSKGNRFSGSKPNPKVVQMKKQPPQMQVSMLKPTSIDDAECISDSLQEGQAVLINLEGIHTDVAQRIIDFASGATYSMSGNLQKISNYIFIATPKSVKLSGEFQKMLTETGLDVSGLSIRM